MFLSKLAAVSARNLLLPEVDPASRTFFVISILHTDTGLLEHVYRSEGVAGSANPEWTPLSAPFRLPLADPHITAFVSVYQTRGKGNDCVALRRPVIWSAGKQEIPLQIDYRYSTEYEAGPTPLTGDRGCADNSFPNDQREPLNQDEEQTEHYMDYNRPSTDMVVPDSSSLKLKAAKAAEHGKQPQPPACDAADGIFRRTNALSGLSPTWEQGCIINQTEPGTSKLIQKQELKPENLYLISDELRSLSHSLAPNTVILDTENGQYALPPPLFAPMRATSAVSSPTKKSSLQPADHSPRQASPSSSAPRRFATMLMSKLMRSTPNLQGMGDSHSRQQQDSDEESEVSVAGRSASHVGMGDAAAFTKYAKQMSLSDVHVHVTVLVSLRSSIIELDRQSMQLKDRLEGMIGVRKLAREQQTQVHDIKFHAQSYRQRSQQIQQELTRVQKMLSDSRKASTVRAQALITSLKVMQAAERKLSDGQESLAGDEGRERLVGLHRELVARRCLMVSQLGKLYRLGPITVKVLDGPPGGYLEERLERQWVGEQSLTAPPNLNGIDLLALNGNVLAETPRQRQEARMSIGGIELRSSVWRAAFDSSAGEVTAEEDQAAAVALGYVAHLVQRLAKYLDVQLRYPIAWLGSKSSIFEGLAPANTWSTEEPAKRAIFGRLEHGAQSSSVAVCRSSKPVEYPLFCNSRRERQQFAVGVFLLNKNVTQLLQAHGITAGGPNHLLHNLYKLLLAAHSALPCSQPAA